MAGQYDFSYLMGAKPIEMPDPIESAGRAMSLSTLASKNQLAQYTLQQTMRDAQRSQLVNQAIPELQAGGFSDDALRGVIQKYGPDAAIPLIKATQDYRKQAAATSKDEAATAKDRADTRQKGINIAGNMLNGVANGDVPLTPVTLGAITAQMRHVGTPDEILSTMPDARSDPEGLKQWAKVMAAAAANPEQQAQIWQINQKTPVDIAKSKADTNRTNVEAQYIPINSQSQRISANAAASNAATRKLELNPLGVPPSAAVTGSTGDEFLKTLAPSDQTTVKAIAEGRMAIPSGSALRSPYWQSVISAVGQYDPSFDAANANSRVATRKDFTSGKSAQSANALNTALGHVESLLDAGQGLNNTGLPIWNKVKNFASQQTGDPQVNQFEVTKNAVVDEMVRAYRNAGGTEQDVKSWGDQLSSASSPEQLKGVASQMVHLLSSKIDAMNDTYRKGMGTTAQGLDLLTPKSRATMERLGVSHNVPDAAANSGAPSAASNASGSKDAPVGKIVKSGSRFAVTDPDGQTHYFPNEGAAFEFTVAARLR